MSNNHFAITFNKNVFDFFFNGVKFTNFASHTCERGGSTSVVDLYPLSFGNIYETAATLKIGVYESWCNGIHEFDGLGTLDELRFYNRVPIE